MFCNLIFPLTQNVVVLTHNHSLQCAPFLLLLLTLHSQLALTHIPLLLHLYFFISISSCSCFILPQCVLEEMASREQELCRLRERAHCLWEGQAAGKGFVHRVSQLSAQYLALSNLTKVILFPPCNHLPSFLSTYLCFYMRNAAAC